MKRKYNFELSTIDKQFFIQMQDSYISEAERIFFSTMEYKEQHEPTYMYELLILEDENEDKLFFIRMNVSEYRVGINKMEYRESLKDTLDIDLFDIGHTEHISLFDWLRKRNYSNIHYDRNNDLL